VIPGYLPGTRVTGIETGTRLPFRALVAAATAATVAAAPAGKKSVRMQQMSSYA